MYGVPDVYTWDKLFKTDGFEELDMLQTVRTPGGTEFATTRCPITIDREHYKSAKAAPAIGQHNNQYILQGESTWNRLFILKNMK